MSDFKVVFGEKEDTVILLILGDITPKEIPDLEAVQPLLEEKKQLAIIISLRDVNNILPTAYSAFVRLMTSIRKQGKILGLCSIRPDIKALLTQAGVIREAEIYNNIPECWNGLHRKLGQYVASAALKSG